MGTDISEAARVDCRPGREEHSAARAGVRDDDRRGACSPRWEIRGSRTRELITSRLHGQVREASVAV
jgi:hypothetical protein